MDLPGVPLHLAPYLPGRMKVHDLDPVTWRSTDMIDLELGAAVQAAWQRGVADAKDDHEARQATSGG